MVQEAECPVVVLASGQILKMRGVLLYDETLIRELAAFKTMVAGKLGMQATGQAFIRAPAWMLGAAAAALSCEPAENSSTWVRDSPQRSATSSAPRPWLGTTPS